MRWFLVFICILFFCCILFADEEVTILEVQGVGTTLSEAVQNGLIEAVKQSKGVNIESQKVFTKNIRESSLSTSESSLHNIKIDEHSQSLVREATQGLVQEYRIVESSLVKHNEWVTKLAVKLVSYKTPGISPHGRRKIAVIPFRSTKSSFTLNGVAMASSEVSRRFSQALVTELTQSRRFTVLDREYMEEFLREKSLILSGNTPVSELMKIGEVLGVDYLLIGTISEVYQRQTPYAIQVTGEKGYEYSASFVADYRIIVMATRQVKWADSVNIIINDSEIKKLSPSLKIEEIKHILFSKTAKNIIHKAMENIYPIRVVKVQPNGEIILNQGGITVEDGEIFDVFTEGGKVTDPYTKESLGSSETWVASIKISRVLAKMSYSKVVEGEISLIQNGSICRRQKEKSQQLDSPGKTTDVQIIPHGGVVLPFDK